MYWLHCMAVGHEVLLCNYDVDFNYSVRIGGE